MSITYRQFSDKVKKAVTALPLSTWRTRTCQFSVVFILISRRQLRAQLLQLDRIMLAEFSAIHCTVCFSLCCCYVKWLLLLLKFWPHRLTRRTRKRERMKKKKKKKKKRKIKAKASEQPHHYHYCHHHHHQQQQGDEWRGRVCIYVYAHPFLGLCILMFFENTRLTVEMGLWWGGRGRSFAPYSYFHFAWNSPNVCENLFSLSLSFFKNSVCSPVFSAVVAFGQTAVQRTLFARRELNLLKQRWLGTLTKTDLAGRETTVM